MSSRACGAKRIAPGFSGRHACHLFWSFAPAWLGGWTNYVPYCIAKAGFAKVIMHLTKLPFCDTI